ncbi:Hypothetical protein, putative [Bodo saltans]|uniref:Uncharacterized protein n=1 Tax=Bodo saltans TaxID=75058 RepID=A0A0S4J7W2_BODSA|nr:Hypothetical protein, putative [Bodo saltans]|eukprot:CUG87590.1 Hypothetical protein, putative [Bodo saltans]
MTATTCGYRSECTWLSNNTCVKGCEWISDPFACAETKGCHLDLDSVPGVCTLDVCSGSNDCSNPLCVVIDGACQYNVECTRFTTSDSCTNSATASCQCVPVQCGMHAIYDIRLVHELRHGILPVELRHQRMLPHLALLDVHDKQLLRVGLVPSELLLGPVVRLLQQPDRCALHPEALRFAIIEVRHYCVQPSTVLVF